MTDEQRTVLDIYSRTHTGLVPDAIRAILAERDYFVRHEEAARARCERLELELRATYDELNKALGGNAPKSWDRIKAVIDGDA